MTDRYMDKGSALVWEKMKLLMQEVQDTVTMTERTVFSSVDPTGTYARIYIQIYI